MHALEALIKEIEARIEANDYKAGDKVVEERQAYALKILIPEATTYPPALSSEDLRSVGRETPGASTNSRTKAKEAMQAYSYARAVNGLSAAAETTAAQYRATQSTKYSRLMDVIAVELATLVQKNLDASAAAYAPLTAAFKRSAKELKSAYNNAKKTIDALNIAAAVVGAFGKLVAAI